MTSSVQRKPLIREWFILLVAFQKRSTWGPKEKVLAVRWWRRAFQHLNTHTNTRTCPHTPVQVGFLSCFIWSHNNRSKRPRCLSQAFMRLFKNTVSMCEKEVVMMAVQTLRSKDRCTDEKMHENHLSHSDLLMISEISYLMLMIIF